IHWRTLCLALPPDGIVAHFPTEDACRARFESVRWVSSPSCPKCRSDGYTHLASRALRQCRACRHQYSATTAAPLERTRLGILQWFLAAEAVILHRDASMEGRDIPALELGVAIGVS